MIATTSKWNILVVDDESSVCDDIKELFDEEKINGTPINVVVSDSFDNALDLLEERKIDLVILDVRLGAQDSTSRDEEAGERTLNLIKSRRFVPVVFHTGIPPQVEHLKSNFISIIPKGNSDKLWEEVNRIFNSHIPTFNKAIIHHFEDIQRQYMWEFVSDNWSEISEDGDTELAYLLARRLSLSLSAQDIVKWHQILKGNIDNRNIDEVPENSSEVHPITYYVIPPISENSQPGDIYSKIKDSEKHFKIVLTPSCDLVMQRGGVRKSDFVLLATVEKLETTQEYLSLVDALPELRDADERLKSLQDSILELEQKQKDLNDSKSCESTSSRDSSTMKQLLKELSTSRKEKQQAESERNKKLKRVESSKKILRRLICDFRADCQSERYFFLPGVLKIPNLVVDFQSLESINFDDFQAQWTREASLDSPYSEAILARFSRYFGRVGKPNLDSKYIIDKLEK